MGVCNDCLKGGYYEKVWKYGYYRYENWRKWKVKNHK
jgi:hypothetical protein